MLHLPDDFVKYLEAASWVDMGLDEQAEGKRRAIAAR